MRDTRDFLQGTYLRIPQSMPLFARLQPCATSSPPSVFYARAQLSEYAPRVHLPFHPACRITRKPPRRPSRVLVTGRKWKTVRPPINVTANSRNQPANQRPGFFLAKIGEGNFFRREILKVKFKREKERERERFLDEKFGNVFCLLFN